MKIEVSKLKHHPFNSQVYMLSDIDTLKESIKSVGLLEPLVINKKNEVLSGNRRLEAIKELELKKVEVIVKELNKEEEPIHIISHNSQRIKTARELLNEIKVLMKHYKKGQGFRSDLTSYQTTRSKASDVVSEELGINSTKLYRLLYIDEVFPQLIDMIDNGKMTIYQCYIEAKRRKIQNTIDDNKDKPNRPTKVTTDRFTIYNKSSANMVELQDKSVDVIMTSPPYYSLRNYGNDKQIGLEKSVEKYIDSLMLIFDECYRVLNDKGSCWVVIGDSYLDGCLGSIPHRFAIEMMKHGWIQRNCIVWHKTNPKPESVKNRLGSSNEFIFYFTKDKQDYLFNADAIRVPYKMDEFRDMRSPRHHNLKGDFQRHTPIVQHQNGKIPLDFIESAKHSYGVGRSLGLDELEHGAVYPPTLCYLPIKSSSSVDDIVLDPFCGSATTGEVSLELGRKFIGYEINSNFVELSKLRLSKKINDMSQKNGKVD